MPKRITEEDYLIAYSVQHKDFKQIDSDENDVLPSPQISAEKAVIKKEAFDRLSQEAKDVVDVILHSPAEIVQLISTPKRKQITPRAIYQHLSKVLHSKVIAKHIIKELREWVRHF